MVLAWQYGEERSMAALLAIRRPSGLTTREAPRLAKWQQGLVTVRHCSIQDAQWRPGLERGGPSRILMPEVMVRWSQRRRLMHELAHPLLDVGLGGIADQATPEERRAFRIARDAERHEEQLADDLVIALRLPAHVLLSGDARDLASLAGLPWSIVERRLKRLNGQILTLDYLPHWCAARTFRMEHVPAAEAHFRILEGDAPVIRVPVDHGNRAARGMRLKADLMALRTDEFRLKYRRYAVADLSAGPWRPQPCWVRLGEMHHWAKLGDCPGQGC